MWKSRNKNIILYRRRRHRTIHEQTTKTIGFCIVAGIVVCIIIWCLLKPALTNRTWHGCRLLHTLPPFDFPNINRRLFALTVRDPGARAMTGGDDTVTFVGNRSHKFIYYASLAFGTWTTADPNTPKVNCEYVNITTWTRNIDVFAI